MGVSIFLLENGYDEEAFANAAAAGPLNPGRLTLLHSGIVYPVERNPSQLFAALGQLRQSRPEVYSRLIVRFRAPVHDVMLKELARRHAVDDAIEVLPPVDYREALREAAAEALARLPPDENLRARARRALEEEPSELVAAPLRALLDAAGDNRSRVKVDTDLAGIAMGGPPSWSAATSAC